MEAYTCDVFCGGEKMDQNTTGYNINDVRRNNVSAIIRLLHRAKVCSRADLARATGLKQATITNIINELIESEFVIEVGHIEGRMKRRSIGISLNKVYQTIGIRLERNYLKACLFNIMGEPLEIREKEFPEKVNAHEVVSWLVEIVQQLIDGTDQDKLLGIGLAIPGPFLQKNQQIELMSGFPGWQEIDFKKELEDQFSLPVYIEHNANCGALSEMWYGDIGDNKNVIFIAADIGIGAGILINQQLYKGALGIAGEIGHMCIDYSGPKCECGNRGCLELYCSTRRLKQIYKEEVAADLSGGENECSTKEILKKAAGGDATARRALSKIAVSLAYGIANIVNLFNPDLIIISDKLSLAGEALIEELNRILKELLLESVFANLNIRLGRFAEDAMVYGASALVLEECISSPFLTRLPIS